MDRSKAVIFYVRGVEAMIPEGVDALNVYIGNPHVRIGEARRCSCGEHAVWIPEPSYEDKWGVYV